jgi:enamine deaminase RidA (YjgF/YER057c/UK114 family)
MGCGRAFSPDYHGAGRPARGVRPNGEDEMTVLRFMNPGGIAKPGGYSHVVEIVGPGRIVYIAGQLGLAPDGTLADGFRAQAVQAYENLKTALTSVGAGFDDVVKLNNYIVDIKTNIPHHREIRDRYVNVGRPPASTTIGVPALARDGALYEVEAVVVLKS